MVHVIVENRFKQPISEREFRALMCGPCLAINNIQWQDSLLSADGRRMLCWFQGPDAESVRIVLRNQGLPVESVWSANVQAAAADLPLSTIGVNLIVEIEAVPIKLVGKQVGQSMAPVASYAALSATAPCSKIPDADFICAFTSLNGRRRLCMYRVKEAGSQKLHMPEEMNGRELSIADSWMARSLANQECASGPLPIVH